MTYTARPEWRNQWWQIIIAAVIAVLFVVTLIGGERYFSQVSLRVVLVVLAAVFVYLLATIVYRRFSWRYTIDAVTIESRKGLIARNVQSIRIQDLRNINVSQSLVQRVLGIGNVEFSSAGGGGVEVVFFGVDDPMNVKALAQRLQG